MNLLYSPRIDLHGIKNPVDFVGFLLFRFASHRDLLTYSVENILPQIHIFLDLYVLRSISHKVYVGRFVCFKLLLFLFQVVHQKQWILPYQWLFLVWFHVSILLVWTVSPFSQNVQLMHDTLLNLLLFYQLNDLKVLFPVAIFFFCLEWFLLLFWIMFIWRPFKTILLI